LAIIYLIDKHLEAHRKQFWQVPLIYAALTFYLAALFVTSMSFLHIPLIDVPNPTSFDYLYFSIITMTSVGYGDLTPISEKGKIVSLAMSIIGSGHMLVSVVLFIDKVKSQPVNPNAE
jgi:voltage-gated potassium channel